MRRFIENNFALMMILACLAGLAIPWLGELPNISVVITLALLMFVSCYKLRDGALHSIRWRDIVLFYLLRYVLLPLALWLAASLVIPDYAMAVFLLSAVPAGTASPAITGIYGGSIAAAFAIVIVSQLLTPFMIPAQFAWIGADAAGPTPAALFTTMAWCIFLPMSVYAVLRHHRRSAAYMHAQNKLFSVLLAGFLVALAIARQRDVILSGEGLAASLAISLLCFFIYIVSGWCAAYGRAREDRIAYAASSSFNNASLAVSLALLHFPAKVILFTAVSEIAWALLPLMFRGFLKWRKT